MKPASAPADKPPHSSLSSGEDMAGDGRWKGKTQAGGGNPTRIALVDDHAMLRQLIQLLCEQRLDCEVIVAAASGREAVRAIAQVKPDLVILDVYLPDLTGFAVAKEIRLVSPGTRILLISGHCDQNTLHLVAHAEVDGFLDKSSDTVRSLHEAVAATLAGRGFWSARFRATRRELVNDPHSPFKILSDWEQKILCQIGQCATDEEIAAQFGITGPTAKRHRSNLLHKLCIHSTPKLIAYARAMGFCAHE